MTADVNTAKLECFRDMALGFAEHGHDYRDQAATRVETLKTQLRTECGLSPAEIAQQVYPTDNLESPLQQQASLLAHDALVYALAEKNREKNFPPKPDIKGAMAKLHLSAPEDFVVALTGEMLHAAGKRAITVAEHLGTSVNRLTVEQAAGRVC